MWRAQKQDPFDGILHERVVVSIKPGYNKSLSNQYMVRRSEVENYLFDHNSPHAMAYKYQWPGLLLLVSWCVCQVQAVLGIYKPSHSYTSSDRSAMTSQNPPILP